MIDPEIGFTSDVIRDSSRFVGRTDLVRDCIRALNSPLGLIAVYGKRGVGKSSLLRQIQQMAVGDYSLAIKSGLKHEIPDCPREYLSVYYTCDSMIKNVHNLLQRLCNDQNEEDGLLRLVPDDGKELVAFSRSAEASVGMDLKVLQWGGKGILSSKYARVVENDIVQTFRNYISAIVTHQVKNKMNRDGLLIILDEFDVVQDKEGFGSLIKSLSSETVKFAICGIGNDLQELVTDHGSVERLLEQGAIHVRPMSIQETEQILDTAEALYRGELNFDAEVRHDIAIKSAGYPYITQLMGKECVNQANTLSVKHINQNVYDGALNRIRSGTAFPTLERQYQQAIGASNGRQILLHLLASLPEENALFNDEVGRVLLKKIRADAQDLDIEHMDQLIPRLLDQNYGPALIKVPERQGVYEFANPVFRVYVNLRNF